MRSHSASVPCVCTPCLNGRHESCGETSEPCECACDGDEDIELERLGNFRMPEEIDFFDDETDPGITRLEDLTWEPPDA